MPNNKELQKIEDFANQILSSINKIKSGNITTTPIANLGLSSRSTNCLTRHGIMHLYELLELQKHHLLCIRNMGTKTFDEINKKVKSLGFNGWD